METEESLLEALRQWGPKYRQLKAEGKIVVPEPSPEKEGVPLLTN